MADTPFALYKLIVLYSLKQSADSLTNAQLSNLFLDNDYTSYFRLQEVLSEMVETALLTTEIRDETTYYSLSEQGGETLRYFAGDISPEIRNEVRSWLKAHAKELRHDAQITASYTRSRDGDFSVHCRAEENGEPLLDLVLHVPTESAAQKAAENWKARSQETYATLIRSLLS